MVHMRKHSDTQTEEPQPPQQPAPPSREEAEDTRVTLMSWDAPLVPDR